MIDRSEIDKVHCLDFECKKVISANKVKSILTSIGKVDLYEKYERFSKKKQVESDPLVRYCTKPGCEMIMRAENFDVKKLTCPSCST